MPKVAEDPLLTELARDVVARAAPTELPLYPAITAAYLEDPDRAVAAAESRDDPLGFGAEAAAALITPVALAVVSDVLRFLRAEVAKHAKDEGSDAIGRLVRRLFRPLHDNGGAPEAERLPAGADHDGLTREQLTQVRALALEKARELRLSKERATLLADSIVGSLAVAA
jgi:hypothetical protein